MELHGWITIAIGATAAAAFVRRWAPAEAIALAIPVALAASGVFDDPLVALQGFGNPAVIALAAIFVVGAGLQSSGLAAYVAGAISRGGGQNETRTMALLMPAAALVSGFMSNAATTALFLPATVRIARRSSLSPSRLLLPMASAAVLGGTLTLIGTPPNLLISGYLADNFGRPFSIFRFAIIGVPILFAGILYTVTIGRRLLPDHSDADRLRGANVPEDLVQSYQLARQLYQMKVAPNSSVCGQTIAETKVRQKYGLSVVLIRRRRGLGTRYLNPQPDMALKEGDLLYMEGETERAWQFAEEEGLQFGLAGPEAVERILGRGQTIAEVSVSPRSAAVGNTLRDLRFRSHFSLNVISLWRQGSPVENHADAPLELGDALIVSGTTPHLQQLATDPDYIVLTDLSEAADTRRAPLALLLLVLAVLPPILGLMPLAVSALGAAILMVLTGCVNPDNARRAVEWKVVFLIAGTLPLGLAMETTGVAATVAQAILGVTAPLGPAATLAGLFVLAAAVSVTSSNSAAAVIIAPIAANIASHGEIGLEPALLAVAYGCSCAFVLPFSQWNLMVMGPGGYTAGDFLRFGAGLSLVMGVTTIGMLTLLGG